MREGSSERRKGGGRGSKKGRRGDNVRTAPECLKACVVTSMHWLLDEEDKPQVQLAPGIIKEAELLQDAPFLFPFVERVRFFNSLVVQDRFLVQGPYQAFLQGHSLNITVHRDYVYEDAFTGLGKGIGESGRDGAGGLRMLSGGWAGGVVRWVGQELSLMNGLGVWSMMGWGLE